VAHCEEGWEYAARAWVEFVRSDVLYRYNACRFLSLIPPPRGLTVDVGCGEGRLARALRARGYGVLGVDASPTLVSLAAEADPIGDYRVATAAALPLGDGSARLVVAFMVMEHVRDLDAACAEARRVLCAGGSFCFAMVHPARSGGGFEDAGEEARFVLDSYFPARAVKRPLFETEVVAYHRPLSDYATALHGAGFVVARLAELPSQRRAAGRVPMFMHVAALALQ
jgi:SAM-dependent methyltransferase